MPPQLEAQVFDLPHARYGLTVLPMSCTNSLQTSFSYFGQVWECESCTSQHVLCLQAHKVI